MKRMTWMLVMIGVLAVAEWACSGINDANAPDCGTKLNATSAYMIASLAGENLYSLSSAINASSKCEAAFSMTFRYADPARAAVDSTMPPLIGLDSIFHANADTIVFSHGAPVRSKTTMYQWKITGSGNNGGSSNPKSSYYIKVLIGASPMEDSTLVTGSIDYSLQK